MKRFFKHYKEPKSYPFLIFRDVLIVAVIITMGILNFGNYIPQKVEAAAVFSDDFTGINGDPWDSAKWTTNVSGTSGLGLIDIQNNEGRMRHGGASEERTRAIASSASEATDQEVLLKFRYGSLDVQHFYVWLRGSGDWVDAGPNAWKPNNGYGIKIKRTDSTTELYRVVGGTETIIGTGTIHGTGTNYQWLRFRVESDTISAKIWDDGTAEPGSWELTATDSQVTGPGRLQLVNRRGATGETGRDLFVDNVTVYDLTSPSVNLGTPVAGFGTGNTLDLNNVSISGSERGLLVGACFINNDDVNDAVTSVVLDPGGASQTSLTHLDNAAAIIQNDGRCELWGAVNPPTGTYTVRITLNVSLASNDGFIAGAWPLSNIDQFDPFGTVAVSSSTAGNANVTVPSASGETVFGVAFTENNLVPNMSGDAIVDWSFIDAGGSGDSSVGQHQDATTASENLSWTNGSDKWAAIGVSVKPYVLSDLSVGLAADNPSGTDPHPSSLTANVFGTETGPIDYNFWWHCPNQDTEINVNTVESACGALPTPSAGSCADNSAGYKCIEVSDNPKQTISHTYSPFDTYNPKVIVERGSAASATDTDTITVTPSSTGDVDVRVSQGSDDAEEDTTNGNISLGSSDLELLQENELQVVGVRFQNIDIPQGANITSAYIEFTEDQPGIAGSVTLSIRGHDTDSSPTFTTATNHITNRTPLTSSEVLWTSSSSWAGGSKHYTPNLAPIIQEIVNRGGWTNNNAMSFIISLNSGTGSRVARSYDGDPANAARLVVDWDPPLTTPQLSSPSHSNVTVDSADLSATIDSDGGEAITERGFCWDTNSNPTHASGATCIAEGGTATGTFSDTISSLPSSTEVFYEGYAQNSVGYGYTDGNNSFITNTGTLSVSLESNGNSPTDNGTEPYDAVLRASVSGTENGTMNYSFWWNCSDSTTSVATASDPLVCGPLPTSGTCDNVGCKYDGTNTNPQPTTSAYTYNAGLHTGKVIVERGGALPAEARVTIDVSTASTTPQLSSPSHSNVTVDSADLSATIDSDGGEAITERGFCWDTNSNPTHASGATCIAEGGTATGTFSDTISSLPSSTEVFYEGYAQNSVGYGYTDGNNSFITGVANSAPILQPTSGKAVSDDSPVFEEAEVSLTIAWSDPDGDSVYAIFCKTDEVNGSTVPPSCPGGEWASATSPNGSPTITLSYPVNSTDIPDKSYYGFVCDPSGACTPSTSTDENDGSFDVYGTPADGFPLSGRVEAEDYRAGGFSDTDLGNTGGVYRFDTGTSNNRVDIGENTDGGFDRNIGWTAPGEYVEYDVDVPSSGTYTLEFRVANGSGSTCFGCLEVQVDGQSGGPDVTGPIDIPTTSDWDDWTTVTVNGVYLDASPHVVTLIFNGNFNLNWFIGTAEANSAPQLDDFIDNAPVTEGANVIFTVDWSDPDTPFENVKVHICKTNNITPSGTGGFCTDDTWRSTGLIDSSFDPVDLIYTTQAADVATSPNDYYVYICDDAGACSDPINPVPNDGTFDVDPSSGLSWGITFDGNTEEFQGWAWGDEVIGWASFSSTTEPVQPPAVNYSVKSTPFNAGPAVLGANVLFSPSNGPTCTSQMRFSWDFSDPEDGDTCDDPNSLCGYRVQVSRVVDSFIPANLQFDSGVVRSGAEERFVTIANPPTDEFNDNVADGDGTLAFNTTYYWRVQVYDSAGEPSNWYTYQDNIAPSDPFATSLHPYPEPDFTWTCYDPSDGITEKPNCDVPVEIQFDSTSSIFYTSNSANDAWQWIFPPEFTCNTPGSGCDVVENPRVDVSTAGNYSVTLTAIDGELASDSNSGNGRCSLTRLVTGQYPLPEEFREVTPVGFLDKIMNMLGRLFSMEFKFVDFAKSLLAIK